MQKFVNVEALNFRSSPEVASDNRIDVLHLCQPVKQLSEPDAENWANVEAKTVEGKRKGFVAARFLRDPVSPEREALIAQAIHEWLRFEKGLGKEDKDPFAGFVGEMWSAIGMDLDGRDTDVPWSAAAISFMVRHAGKTVPLYENFRFAAAHARYINDAIVKRQAGDADAPFWGFRLHERRPQLGDMVARWRKAPIDFDGAAVRDRFSSHCDIVVQVAENEVLTIGGNVSNSVKTTAYDKTPAGFLDDTKNVFALLASNAP